MKYTILINQVGIKRLGLQDKTDLIDWAIIDYLRDWYFSGYARKIAQTDPVAGEHVDFVWVNYRHLLENMPMLGIKTKDGLAKRFNKLKKLGLIRTFQTKDNSLYFILTKKCISVYYYKEKDTCPTAVGQPVELPSDSLSNSGRTPYRTAVGQPVELPSDSTSSISLSSKSNSSKTKSRLSKVEKDIYVQFFEKEFWPLYPNIGGRKRGRKKTLEKIISKVPIDKLPLLKQALENYTKSPEVQRGFEKEPARFIENRNWSWEDWIEYSPPISEKSALDLLEEKIKEENNGKL